MNWIEFEKQSKLYLVEQASQYFPSVYEEDFISDLTFTKVTQNILSGSQSSKHSIKKIPKVDIFNEISKDPSMLFSRYAAESFDYAYETQNHAFFRSLAESILQGANNRFSESAGVRGLSYLRSFLIKLNFLANMSLHEYDSEDWQTALSIVLNISSSSSRILACGKPDCLRSVEKFRNTCHAWFVQSKTKRDHRAKISNVPTSTNYF